MNPTFTTKQLKIKVTSNIKFKVSLNSDLIVRSKTEFCFWFHNILFRNYKQSSGVIMKSDIVNTFRLFDQFAVELMLKNFGYSELGYNESLVIINPFQLKFCFFPIRCGQHVLNIVHFQILYANNCFKIKIFQKISIKEPNFISKEQNF